MASKVEVCGPVPSSQAVGMGSDSGAVEGMTVCKVTREDVQQVKCLTEAMPAKLSAEQHAQPLKFICDNAAAFSKAEFDIGVTHLVEHSTDFRQSSGETDSALAACSLPTTHR